MRNQGLPLHINPTHRFRWNSYWGTWNRVLQYPVWYETDRCHLNTIEFSLTTKNGDHDFEWKEVSSIRIRKHGTRFDAKDTTSNVIPMEWYDLMGLRLGEKLRDFMLYREIKVSDIDWKAYEKLVNGGVPLHLVWKGKIDS